MIQRNRAQSLAASSPTGSALMSSIKYCGLHTTVGHLPEARFHCGRYHAFPGSASLPDRIHRTAFRRSGRQRRQPQTAVGFAAQSRFRCVDRAFRVPPFGNWWMGWRFTTSFWQKKSRRPFSDFLLGVPLCRRRVFSCKSSGQVDPM